VSNIRALIIEDDPTISASLERLLKKEGLEVYSTLNQEEAIALTLQKKIRVVFLDCLLPETGGTDIAKALRERFSKSELKVILMSGVFLDKQFVKDAIAETEADGFLKKPFELGDVRALLQSLPGGVSGADISGDEDEDESDQSPQQEIPPVSPRQALYQLFSRGKASFRDKKKVIEALEEIHGFDLPFLYSLLVDSKSSGHLNIVNHQGQISGISLSNGIIVSVDVPDKESVLGKLLIEGGFIHPDDLDNYVLNFPKRMGQSLIKNNLLSPHAFDAVLSEQMNIRLSRTVVDMGLRFNFVPAEVDIGMPNIDSTRFELFLHDWIAGKLSKSWLRAHYMQWSEFKVKIGPAYDPNSPLLNASLLKHLDGFVERVVAAESLHDIVDSKQFPEEAFYKALHYLFCKGFLVFSNNLAQQVTVRSSQIVRIRDAIKGKNPLEVMEEIASVVGTDAGDYKQTYESFAEYLGENSSSDKEVQGAYSQAKKIVDEAFRILQNSSAKTKLKEEMVKSEIEGRMRASEEFEKARDMMHKGQFVAAIPILNRVYKLDSNLSGIRAYLIWAKIGTIDQAANRNNFLKEIDIDIAQIPTEEKYNGLSLFVQALLLKQKGDLVNSKKLIEKALAVEPGFVPAKRELAQLDQRARAAKEDKGLSAAVSGLFKRKSS
jgi:DNA-binding response OmpR family regulator/tetratricopeptide (TPR) repeat protein